MRLLKQRGGCQKNPWKEAKGEKKIEQKSKRKRAIKRNLKCKK
jgi:hypothetical protein